MCLRSLIVDLEVFNRYPGFQIFQCLDIRIDIDRRFFQYFAVELSRHQVNLISVDMAIHIAVIGILRILAGDLGHQSQKQPHLHHVGCSAKRKVTRQLCSIEIATLYPRHYAQLHVAVEDQTISLS